MALLEISVLVSNIIGADLSEDEHKVYYLKTKHIGESCSIDIFNQVNEDDDTVFRAIIVVPIGDDCRFAFYPVNFLIEGTSYKPITCYYADILDVKIIGKVSKMIKRQINRLKDIVAKNTKVNKNDIFDSHLSAVEKQRFIFWYKEIFKFENKKREEY